MAKCNFCGNVLKPATGKMFIKKEGTVLYFCSMKCEKNMFKLGRKARDMKWTKSYEKGAAPEKK